MILRLTWRNLWRNPRRTLITTTSVSFAVLLAILMQSFQKGVFGHLVDNVVGFYYGYIQVHRTGYWKEPILENSFEEDPQLLGRIRALEGVVEVVPRLESFMLAASRNLTRGCLLTGTRPEAENTLTALKSKLISGQWIREGEEAVLVAEGLARRLNLRCGDSLVLLGQGYQEALAAGKYRVNGLLHFGSPELNESLVFLPLAAAQDLLQAPGRLSSLSLKIEDPQAMQGVQAAVIRTAGNGYEVMNWEELMPEIANHIRADRSSFYIFTGILYFIIAFGLFGTLLMMLTERRYELGLLLAIGMNKRKLALQMLGESLLMTLLGALAGILLSYPVARYFHRYPIRLRGRVAEVYERFGFEALFPADLDGRIILVQTLTVLVIALTVSLYPSWHVIRLQPVTAMKK